MMNDASSVAGRGGAARRDRYSTIDSHGGFGVTKRKKRKRLSSLIAARG